MEHSTLGLQAQNLANPASIALWITSQKLYMCQAMAAGPGKNHLT